MSNIQTYIQTVLNAIFGGQFTFYLPYQVFGWLSNLFVDAMVASSPLEYFFLSLVTQPQYIFSLFIWLWFAFLVFRLTILFPYNWLRSIIRKCKG